MDLGTYSTLTSERLHVTAPNRSQAAMAAVLRAMARASDLGLIVVADRSTARRADFDVDLIGERGKIDACSEAIRLAFEVIGG